MEFIIFLTERCNLACTYCGEGQARAGVQQDVTYDPAVLIDFLRQAPDVGLDRKSTRLNSSHYS